MSTHRAGLLLVRIAALLGVLVLICVPALTRVGQKLETSSRTPSFSRNIDCPPKKVTVAPAPVILTATSIDLFETAPVVRLLPSVEPARPRSLFLAVPRPLRAPPSALLA